MRNTTASIRVPLDLIERADALRAAQPEALRPARGRVLVAALRAGLDALTAQHDHHPNGDGNAAAVAA